MTEEELERAILDEPCRVAPEVDPDSIDRDENLQRALEIDSFDVLNLLVALRDKLGVFASRNRTTPDSALWRTWSGFCCRGSAERNEELDEAEGRVSFVLREPRRDAPSLKREGVESRRGEEA